MRPCPPIQDALRRGNPPLSLHRTPPRPCTPIFVGTAPRESVFKSAPYSAAPVGKPSQTRRHHLTPTPVQQLCTNVQSCGQKRFFSYTGRGAFSFWR